MEKLTYLKNIEIDEPLRHPEFQIKLNREKIRRLSISPSDIASTLRTGLEGRRLFSFTRGEEEVDVRLTTVDSAKESIHSLLKLPVENNRNYLVPLKTIVHVKKVLSPTSIVHRQLKRTTSIDAGISPLSKKSPLEIAGILEKTVFPKISEKFPTAILSFEGEIRDSRESQSDFRMAAFLVVFLIFVVLAVLYNSLIKPILIMLAIPLGIIGVIIAFWLHGKTSFGFFAAVGTLGMIGVVVNDAIVMVAKLEKEFDSNTPRNKVNRGIAKIAQTRLRAIILTTLTTVAGVFPTAYGFAGYDAMLADMMIALVWGLIVGTSITLVFIPCLYSLEKDIRALFSGQKA